MAAPRSRCTACGKVTKFDPQLDPNLEPLPPGITQATCSICGMWKVVFDDEEAALLFIDTPIKRPRKSKK